MNYSKKPIILKCEVCGGASGLKTELFHCNFCSFKKKLIQAKNPISDDLIYIDDVNEFFRNKHVTLKRGETFELIVPVSRFYKTPMQKPGQINFFKSKNIMFLIEQHGFQFISRKSRFSTTLSLTIRKV